MQRDVVISAYGVPAGWRHFGVPGGTGRTNDRSNSDFFPNATKAEMTPPPRRRTPSATPSTAGARARRPRRARRRSRATGARRREPRTAPSRKKKTPEPKRTCASRSSARFSSPKAQRPRKTNRRAKRSGCDEPTPRTCEAPARLCFRNSPPGARRIPIATTPRNRNRKRPHAASHGRRRDYRPGYLPSLTLYYLYYLRCNK